MSDIKEFIYKGKHYVSVPAENPFSCYGCAFGEADCIDMKAAACKAGYKIFCTSEDIIWKLKPKVKEDHVLELYQFEEEYQDFKDRLWARVHRLGAENDWSKGFDFYWYHIILDEVYKEALRIADKTGLFTFESLTFEVPDYMVESWMCSLALEVEEAVRIGIAYVEHCYATCEVAYTDTLHKKIREWGERKITENNYNSLHVTSKATWTTTNPGNRTQYSHGIKVDPPSIDEEIITTPLEVRGGYDTNSQCNHDWVYADASWVTIPPRIRTCLKCGISEWL